MTEATPERALEWTGPEPPPGIGFECSCGTTTHVQFDGTPPDGQEFAITCDGCQTSYWFTASVIEDGQR